VKEIIPDAWKKVMMEHCLNMSKAHGIDPALCYKNHDMLPGNGTPSGLGGVPFDFDED
jgi:hypothetical protein